MFVSSDEPRKFFVLPTDLERFFEISASENRRLFVAEPWDLNIAFAGKIPFSHSGHGNYGGMARIWVQRNALSGKVRYVVSVDSTSDYGLDAPQYWIIMHAPLALHTAMTTYPEIIRKALIDVGINLEPIDKLLAERDAAKEAKKQAELKARAVEETLNRAASIDPTMQWTFIEEVSLVKFAGKM
jgi:hypothetical protein